MKIRAPVHAWSIEGCWGGKSPFWRVIELHYIRPVGSIFENQHKVIFFQSLR